LKCDNLPTHQQLPLNLDPPMLMGVERVVTRECPRVAGKWDLLMVPFSTTRGHLVDGATRGRSASSLMPSCCGTPATRTPPWTSYAATVTTSATTTYDACHPSATTTSTPCTENDTAVPARRDPFPITPNDYQPHDVSSNIRSCVRQVRGGTKRSHAPRPTGR